MSEIREIKHLLERLVQLSHYNTHLERENSEKLDRILSILTRQRYAVKITQEFPAMANGVIVGAVGKFLAQLLDNGSPIALPSGASWSWSASDPSVTIAADASDATGGTVDVTIPAGDTSTTVTLTAATTDPTGAPQSGTLSFPVLPVPQQFSVSISQLS